MLGHTKIRTKSGIKYKENSPPGFYLIVDVIPMPISNIVAMKNGWDMLSLAAQPALRYDLSLHFHI